MLVYLDTAIVIYAIEGAPAFRNRAFARLQIAKNAGDDLVTSDLTRAECLIRPLRIGDNSLRDDYLAFLGQTLVVSHPSEVFDRMTSIRAATNFRIPDARHLATAVHYPCGSFLTNDDRLRSFSGINIESLP
jgi:predicted nucleic acid-binding protein